MNNTELNSCNKLEHNENQNEPKPNRKERRRFMAIVKRLQKKSGKNIKK